MKVKTVTYLLLWIFKAVQYNSLNYLMFKKANSIFISFYYRFRITRKNFGAFSENNCNDFINT